MQRQPAGRMLIVPSSLDSVDQLIGRDLSIAAINAPNAFVVSGAESAVATLVARLRERGIIGSELHTSHAFHSAMMEGAMGPFTGVMKSIALREPKVPYVSNVTGTWISAEQATDPSYWGEQLRAPVRFSDGIRTILASNPGVLLEVGPGRSLTTLARQNLQLTVEPGIISSMPDPGNAKLEARGFHQAMAESWSAGCSIEWGAQYFGERRSKVVLPEYLF